jgi:sugar O-acyltransferase (sialic acid O-acetyltransferase NeuD family)
MKKQLVIIGSGGHGRVVADTAVAAGWQVAGFIDDTKAAGHKENDYLLLGGRMLLKDHEVLETFMFIVALGDQDARREISVALAGVGDILATIIHPSSVISPHASVGRGSVLAPGCILNANAKVGEFCILNTGCTVDHDVQLADGVQISPGVNLAGHVSCGEDVFIGAGAIVIPRISIGKGAIVGAGSVVIKDIPAGAKVAGNPARLLHLQDGLNL